jgi:hypothetical protein
VRLAGEEARRLGADWDSELALLRIASGSGLAPAPLLAVPRAGLLVTEYIQHRAPVEAAAKPARLRRVGALLRAVHGLSSAGGIRILDFATQAGKLEAELDRDAALERLRARAARVFARLHADRGDAVPCHNDVHDANVLDDGRRLRLVDWEYGGLGTPCSTWRASRATTRSVMRGSGSCWMVMDRVSTAPGCAKPAGGTTMCSGYGTGSPRVSPVCEARNRGLQPKA